MKVLPFADSHWVSGPNLESSQAASADPCPLRHPGHDCLCAAERDLCPLQPLSYTFPRQVPCTSRILLTSAQQAPVAFLPFLPPLTVCTSRLALSAFLQPVLVSPQLASASLQIAWVSLQIASVSQLIASFSPPTVSASLPNASSLSSQRNLSASPRCLLWEEASPPQQRPSRSCTGNPSTGCASRPVCKAKWELSSDSCFLSRLPGDGADNAHGSISPLMAVMTGLLVNKITLARIPVLNKSQ